MRELREAGFTPQPGAKPGLGEWSRLDFVFARRTCVCVGLAHWHRRVGNASEEFTRLLEEDRRKALEAHRRPVEQEEAAPR